MDMAQLFRIPLRHRISSAPNGGTEWLEETLKYHIFPRAKPQFRTTLDARDLFDGKSTSHVTTRVRFAPRGESIMTVAVHHRIKDMTLMEEASAVDQGGIRIKSFTRRIETDGGVRVRFEESHFLAGPFSLPAASYPEVLLPFLMRAQPWDGQIRAAYSWTADRFVARVYYENRGIKSLSVPGGTFRCHEIWMYPDLNDWIPLGRVLTRLAKPLLPRYSIWLEASEPHRPVRYEGPYGPPGAPEVVLELL